MKPCTRRVVRPVDLDMTVDTASADDAGISIQQRSGRSEIFSGEQLDWMVRKTDLGMTLLTQKGWRSHEQAIAIRTVREVAAHTAFGHRSVFPDEWAAFGCVAIRTEFERRVGAQQRIRCRPVWLMAIVAVDLALEQRHVGTLAKFDTLSRMAAETGPLDTRFPQQIGRRDIAHRIVAITAGKILGLVDRARPVDSRSSRMTLQAYPVQLARRSTTLARESHDLGAVAGIFEMLTAGTVTGLATAPFESGPRIPQKDIGVNGVGPMLGLDLVA